MTLPEIWTVIADCTRKGDWVGVLVMADALDEAGEAADAEGVRYIVRQGSMPVFHPPVGRWTFDLTIDDVRVHSPCLNTDESIIAGWKWCAEAIAGGWEWLEEQVRISKNIKRIDFESL